MATNFNFSTFFLIFATAHVKKQMAGIKFGTNGYFLYSLDELSSCFVYKKGQKQWCPKNFLFCLQHKNVQLTVKEREREKPENIHIQETEIRQFGLK